MRAGAALANLGPLHLGRFWVSFVGPWRMHRGRDPLGLILDVFFLGFVGPWWILAHSGRFGLRGFWPVFAHLGQFRLSFGILWPLPIRDFRPFCSTFGMPWRASAGFRLIVANFGCFSLGGLWPVAAHFGGPWPILVKFGQFWSFLPWPWPREVKFGQFWPFLPWRALAGFGKLWPILAWEISAANFGQFWSFLPWGLGRFW